jgi:imidazolonepropionase-like amidohydrolase
MKLIVKAGRVVDGAGAAPDARDAVLIEDGRIAAVDRFEAVGVTSDAEVIDVPGGTVLPGFVEVHSHMHCSASSTTFDDLATDSHEALVARAVEAVRAALGSGVTTMRDLGSRNEIAFPIRSAVESGIVPGPHLMVAGTPITTTGGHCHMFGTEADSLDEVLTALRGQVKLGADWIKIMSTGGRFTPRTNPRMPQYPVEVLRAAVVDAERLGVRVAAHCHAASGVRNCVEAGVHNLIHASWMSEDPDGGYDYDPAVADEIAEKGLYVDPTIAATGALRELRAPGWLERNLGSGFDLEQRYEILRDMWDRGVKFVTGLDSGMDFLRFDDYAWVPTLMVEKMGISPLDAIVSGTRTSAECLGVLDETGTLEPGKRADVVVVEGDASLDIRALHSVDTVIKAGKVVKRSGASAV